MVIAWIENFPYSRRGHQHTVEIMMICGSLISLVEIESYMQEHGISRM